MNKDFWNNARREYVSKLASNLMLLCLGALGTTEILKMPLGVRFSLTVLGIALLILGIWVVPKERI